MLAESAQLGFGRRAGRGPIRPSRPRNGLKMSPRSSRGVHSARSFAQIFRADCESAVERGDRGGM
eukprot:6643994-Alexandrium_andersonii.AAC.1